MKKQILLLLIVSSSIIVQSQNLIQDTIFFKSGYKKPCLIVGESQDHIYAKFISMDINPGDTTTLPFEKENILKTNNPKYNKEYFKNYKKTSINIKEHFDIGDQNKLMSYTVASFDQREMILDGSQNEMLLGYTYGAIPVAYPLFNATGQNFSDDFTGIIVTEITKEGISCQSVQTKYQMSKKEIIKQFIDTDSDRYLLFIIDSWRSDSHTPFMGGLKTTISYDITMEVYNKEGIILHAKSIDGKEAPFKGGKNKIRNQNWKSIQDKVFILLNDEE